MLFFEMCSGKSNDSHESFAFLREKREKQLSHTAFDTIPQAIIPNLNMFLDELLH